jgi:hypothetical protein
MSWYNSKTKWAGLLIGGSAFLGTAGAWLGGAMDFNTFFTAAMIDIGAILAVWGIRDWPILNK